MYVRRNIRFKVIWRFTWRNLVYFTVWASFVTWLFGYFDQNGTNIGIPFLPLSTMGIAVAFYLGFKNSQSYDRFWEGRKIWGGIVNVSRHWANQVLSYVTSPDDAITAEQLDLIKRRLILRQLSWINTLRIQLRKTTIFDRKNLTYVPDFGLVNDQECEDCIAYFLQSGEYLKVKDQANAATHILHLQGEDLAALNSKKYFNDFRHMDMMKSIERLYDYQGMCERIKNTPFPRQYAYFSSVFVWIFVLLVPFGLIELFHSMEGDSTAWLNVPFSVLVSWVFVTMESIGDNSEDPFENYVNDVPMSAICRTIEIDLLQMLKEPNIPPKMEPFGDVLL
ncbi:MAG: putative membrane protein [Marinoscillum sp.]|jgi:putative membrane protein